MPPPGTAATRCGHVSRRGDRARARHRPGVGGTSEPRPNRRRAPAESHGVHQRRARPVRARPRREAAAARRRDRRRQLRQPRRCAVDFDGAPRAISVGRSPGHVALATGLPPDESARRDLRDPAPRDPGRSTERGSAVRIARRHRHSATTSPSMASTSSRFGCSASIRTTSKAWDGRSSSTSVWTGSW